MSHIYDPHVKPSSISDLYNRIRRNYESSKISLLMTRIMSHILLVNAKEQIEYSFNGPGDSYLRVINYEIFGDS